MNLIVTGGTEVHRDEDGLQHVAEAIRKKLEERLRTDHSA
jgi:hypothetical protein